ncbi:MAG: CAAX prenyl protease-related protein [Pirellulales bacterium]|nr:CAAX prenyl protease-related protein [Pirellulales bacterium]
MTAEPALPAEPSDPSTHGRPPLPAGWLSRWPWVTFVLPLALFMLAGSLEPTPPAPDSAGAAQAADADAVADAAVDADGGWLNLAYRRYPLVYTAKIVLIVLAMIAVAPGYRAFRGRVSGLAFLVGAVGAVLWIALSKLHLEQHLSALPDTVTSLLGLGPRSAYNPLEELKDDPAWAYGFLAIRFIGLALVVPVIEEFFLRGFLMRFVMHEKWWQVPFGEANRLALVVGTAFPVLYHPEKVAALVWFSLVSWLMVRTKNIWDCVTAHAVTNALLGAYVVATGSWELM